MPHIPDTQEIREIFREEFERVFSKVQPVQVVAPPPDELDLISRKQLIKLLGISAPTFSEWVAKGYLPAVQKIGRRFFFSRSKLVQTMEKKLPRPIFCTA